MEFIRCFTNRAAGPDGKWRDPEATDGDEFYVSSRYVIGVKVVADDCAAVYVHDPQGNNVPTPLYARGAAKAVAERLAKAV